MKWPAIALAAVVGIAGGCGDDGDSTLAETAAEPEAAWGYEGSTGPSEWAGLDPAYAGCAGKAQSPINLDRGEASTPPRLGVSYEPSAVSVENNGRSIEVAYPPGSSIELGDTEYELVQFHFHAPSEHVLSGKRYPIEFHLVHRTDDEGIAVLGVLGAVGKPNPLLTSLRESLPKKEGQKLRPGEKVNALDLLPPTPESSRRWSYEGSLTTPPCTEGIRWTVFDLPIELSEPQLAELTSIYSGTNRPLQPLGSRKLIVGR